MPWDPFSQLGSVAAQIVTDAWTAAWLSVWNAGLWAVLGWVLLGGQLLRGPAAFTLAFLALQLANGRRKYSVATGTEQRARQAIACRG